MAARRLLGAACAALVLAGTGTVAASAAVTPAATQGPAAGTAIAAPAISATQRAAMALTASGRAYLWAVAQRGKPYVWGGTGPYGFDCSGLVMEAYARADRVYLPRTTYAMLGSWHLVRTSSPRKGDLAFYGSGHVELWSGRHSTFGAHDSGSRIGWIRWAYPYWYPTEFMRVR